MKRKQGQADLAKELGEMLLRELDGLPDDQWVRVSFEYRRSQDGDVIVTGLTARHGFGPIQPPRGAEQ